MCIEDIRLNLLPFETRLLTYSNWVNSVVVPASLARAGFFYFNVDDYVECFVCHVVVHDWKEGDDPLSEHIRWSNNCLFARLLWEEKKKQSGYDTVDAS